MKKITINQIMLLLDISRGTGTQICMRSFDSDIKKLEDLGLLVTSINDKKFGKRYQIRTITEKGNKYINSIHLISNHLLIVC
jgi:DNA-binding PadR family transcriptional regulator